MSNEPYDTTSRLCELEKFRRIQEKRDEIFIEKAAQLADLEKRLELLEGVFSGKRAASEWKALSAKQCGDEPPYKIRAGGTVLDVKIDPEAKTSFENINDLTDQLCESFRAERAAVIGDGYQQKAATMNGDFFAGALYAMDLLNLYMRGMKK